MVEETEARVISCCSSCGIAEIDDIELVPCDDCDLVRYCGDECRDNHSLEHEEDCKKRAAELRDELLFKQPESSHLGDCPICCVPLPIDIKKYTMMACCSKTICSGCCYTNQIRQIGMRLEQTCPFCREPLPENNEEVDKQNLKRVEANDPDAMCFEGTRQRERGDYIRAFEYLTKAAELGDAQAQYNLSLLYHEGKGVEKDEGKRIHHLAEAAIGGHPHARYNLGVHEWNNNDDAERAVKHFVMAAAQGYDEAIKTLMDLYRDGEVEKEDLAAALRAHKAAVDATKSPQRLAAEEYERSIRGHPESAAGRS